MGRFVDEATRLLNEQKRRFLHERYAARFPKRASKLSPPQEGAWLDDVTEIEAACAAAGEVPLREYLGHPDLRAPERITPGDLPRELARLDALLDEHQVIPVFAEPMTDTDRYRFMVMNLLDSKIENVRFPVWFTVFLCHPILGIKRLGFSISAVEQSGALPRGR